MISSWDYVRPNGAHTLIIQPILKNVLEEMATGVIDLPTAAEETRPFHERMFKSLTPAGHEYFAGHYRGEPYPYLQFYNVTFGGRVGTFCLEVPHEMELFGQNISQWFPMMEILKQGLPEDVFLLNLVWYAADAFFKFTTIHPYANGNGHAGRYIVWAVLLYFGFRPTYWTIDPRPYPGIYDQAVIAYGAGDKNPLIDLILRSIDTPIPSP